MDAILKYWVRPIVRGKHNVPVEFGARVGMSDIDGFLRIEVLSWDLLEKETLEEFRFLLNYRFDSMSPLALILVGQTELWDEKLRLQRYAAIRQRIDHL